MGWYDNCIGSHNNKITVRCGPGSIEKYLVESDVLYDRESFKIRRRTNVPVTMLDIAEMVAGLLSSYDIMEIDPYQVFFTDPFTERLYDFKLGNMETIIEENKTILFTFCIVQEDYIGCWECEECAKYYKHYDPKKIGCKCPKDSDGEPLSPVYDISCPTCGIDNEDNCLCDNSKYNTNKDE